MKLPDGFINTVPLPETEISDFQEALGGKSRPSFRVNPFKAKPVALFERVPWCQTGYYLDNRPRYTSIPPFHAGALYPQEASSMFIAHILKQLDLSSEPIISLDLCAAPGGKTTLMQTELHKNSLIHANETIQSRFGTLVENLTKWGVPNVLMSNNDPSQFAGLEDFYDLILVDAPCSGEGLFRKQKDAVNQWSTRSVEHCSARQKRILADILPSLRAGGVLIYSTCTFNRLENEENLKWLKSQNSIEFVDVDISAYLGIQEVEEDGIKAYRFFPHKVHGEGFFCSIIRKSNPNRPKKVKLKKRSLKLIRDFERYSLIEFAETLFAVQENQLNALERLVGHFKKSVKPGIEMGRVLRDTLKYSHGRAMLVCSQDHEFELKKLSLAQSLKYLKKEDIPMKASSGRFFVQFNGFNLGFAKSDSRRLISQYPKSWRILNAKEEEYTALVESLK